MLSKCKKFNLCFFFQLMQTSMFSFVAGVCMGGGKECVDAYADFVKNNKATQFESTFHAQRQLQDRVCFF